MVEFQVARRKSGNFLMKYKDNPIRSLNSSFKNNIVSKQPLQECLLNQQLLNEFGKTKEKQSSSKQLLSPRSTYHKFKQSNTMKVLCATQTNFRKTSMSFQKKSQRTDSFIFKDCDVFRKTTTSSKNIAKKNQFFNDFIQSQQRSIKSYKIIGQIGKGSFSKVSSAIDIGDKKVAIKIYDKINGLDWNRLQSIKKQISSLKKIQHENVVSLYDVIKDKNKLYLIMENCGKQTLAGILRKPKGLDQQVVKTYFLQIVQGVSHFHNKGICHRDLKPQNILVDDQGNAKIIDFGFSSSGKTYLTSYCGTPPFMCPQIVQKRPYNGIKADIWALGVMLFLMLNGKLPFKATTQQQLYRLIQGGKYAFTQNCSSQIAKKLIRRMLRVQPQQRITTQQILNHKWFRN